MRIGELARRTGLSPDALRFYEKRGLLRSERRANGYRDFPPEAEFVLRLIKTAQALGFTLGEIEVELPALAGGGIARERVVEILRSKIGTIDERIARLSALRDDLAGRALTACPLLGPAI